MIYRLEIRQHTLAKLARLENCKEIFFAHVEVAHNSDSGWADRNFPL